MNIKHITLLGLVSLSGLLALSAKDFKGAEIYSSESVLYGRFEMSMKACLGSGILSTFFLYKYGSEQSGVFWEEIDIEIFGKNDARSFQANIITDGLSGGNTMSESLHTYSFSLADTFHVYALEWTPHYVAWFFDSTEIRRDSTAQVATLLNPQSYRFNTWVSSSSGWAGSFNPAVLPQKQYVDWLSYYTYHEDSDTAFQHAWTDNFDTFDTDRWGMATWSFDGNLVDFSPNNVAIEDGVLVLSLTDERPPVISSNRLQDGATNVFPNPADDRLFIRTNFAGHPDISIRIHNTAGQEVLATSGNALPAGETVQMDVSALKPGIYVLTIQGNTFLETTKIRIK